MVLGLGAWEIMLAGLALLVFFGPEHAPEAIRTIGRWRRKAADTLRTLEDAMEAESRLEEAPENPPEVETWQLSPEQREALKRPSDRDLPPEGEDT